MTSTVTHRQRLTGRGGTRRHTPRWPSPRSRRSRSLDQRRPDRDQAGRRRADLAGRQARRLHGAVQPALRPLDVADLDPRCRQGHHRAPRRRPRRGHASRAGRPTASRLLSPAASTTRRGSGVQRMDDSPPLFLTRVVGSNHPLPVHRRGLRVVAGQFTHRVRHGHAWPRGRRGRRRPDGDHAVPLQAGRVGGHDALQRQPAPADLHGGPGQPRPAAADAGHLLQPLPGLVAEGRRHSVRVEPRGRSGSRIQLRRVRA